MLPAVVVAFLLGGLFPVATGATMAATPVRLPAFAGIGGADRPRTARDVLDQAAALRVESINQRIVYVVTKGRLTHPLPPPRLFLPGTSRLMGKLPNGSNVYVLARGGDELCILIEDGTSCGAALTPAQPVSIVSRDKVVNGPGATPPLSYGIARDGVTAVSFRGSGRVQTVRVVNNVWAYQGPNSALGSLTVHYTDGTTKTLVH
jgi:hypothetical protein